MYRIHIGFRMLIISAYYYMTSCEITGLALTLIALNLYKHSSLFGILVYMYIFAYNMKQLRISGERVREN